MFGPDAVRGDRSATTGIGRRVRGVLARLLPLVLGMGVSLAGACDVPGAAGNVEVAFAQAALTAAPCTVMQIVAHEDDDLLFMNPDIETQIRNGQCSVTVFVTAGNGEPTVRNRQAGIKDAYRSMAQVADLPGQTEWDAAPLTVAGYPVEQFVLRDLPSVRVVFMNLDDPLSSTGRAGLSKLWNNQATTMAVINPDTDNPTTTPPTTITRSGVSSVLGGLLAMYQPTTVRIQDVLPDSRYMTDHVDHVATALFAQDAVHTYRLSSNVALNVAYYRDYNITSVPPNLDATSRADKDARFYADYVPLNPTAEIDARGFGWTYRTDYRWGRGTAWVGHDLDGRLEAFAVRDGEVFNWSEATDGSWAGSHSLGRPNQGLYPAVAVSTNADGRLQIFARGIDNNVMTAFQTTVGGAWSAWASLGSPSSGTSAPQIGTPAVAVQADGRMRIFVKNGSGALSSRLQSKVNGTSWGNWQSLGGSGLEDAVVALTNRGLIEVFASTTSAVLRWRQIIANGSLTSDPSFISGTPASPPAIGVNQDGRLEVHYRAAGTSSAAPANDLEIVVQDTPGGVWRTTRPQIGNQGGFGEPGLLTTGVTALDKRILAFTRNAGGGVALIRQTSANGGYGTSENLGGIQVDYPAAGLDRLGRVVVFAVGLDGALWMNPQGAADPAGPFLGWSRVGP